MAYPLYLGALLCLAVIFTVQKLASYLSAYRFKKAHGCKPVRRLPQSERILGWAYFRRQMKAVKEKRILEEMRSIYNSHGPTFSSVVLGGHLINTIDPENIKTILASSFADFGLGGRLKAFGPLLGNGIFTSDGAAWEHSRAIVRPNFTRNQVADLDTFETHIQHLIAKIPRDGSTVDLQTLFFQLTLDSSTEFLFGESVSSLRSTEGSEQERFGRCFDFAQSKLGNRTRLGKFSALFRDTEFDEACKTVHKFVDKIVYRALLENPPSSTDPEKSVDGKDASQRYVFLTELVKATRDPKQLRDELLNILLAGRDTTASLLSHTFHVLAQRPDIFKKLRFEVDSLNGELPTYETLKSMKYLKYILNESLRLYPVVPTNGRYANKDTVLPRGGGPDGQSPIFIPKGLTVVYSVYTMHRRTDIFGPDALDFRPERWAPEEGLRPGWAYLPFNGGPRICVGQQFALAEASYAIVRLLQEFERVEDRDGEGLVPQLGLTMASANGVKVAMIPRA